MTIRSKTIATSEPNLDLEALERTCPNCGADMDAKSCKLACSRCGYFKSCSDF